MDALLTADSIGKSFGGRKVLSSAFLWARPGAVTGLVGRNGAGKSTLLKIAAGVLAPDYGVVRFRGESHVRARYHRLAARGLFFLPAERSLLSPSFTVREHLEAAERAAGTPTLEGAVEAMQLAPLLDARPHTLSGGERKRAELALALARAPVCLLADEPFRGIAPVDVERVMQAFRGLAARGCALVVTGHELTFLFQVAHEVIWTTAGTTRVMGTCQEARADWHFRRDFLGAA